MSANRRPSPTYDRFLELYADALDAIYEKCQPDARHDEMTIDEFENDEHAQADLRQRIRDAQ